MLNNKINFYEIKKILKKKNFLIIKKKSKVFLKNNSLESLSKTLLSSLIIIFIFFSLPIIFEYRNKNILFSQDFENNSKNNFDKKLENKNLKEFSKVDQETVEKYLFEDVIKFDDLPTSAIRLNATTIEQLFKDTNYNLDDVRKKKN